MIKIDEENKKKIRPSVVLIKDNKILLVKSRYSTGIFYLLPGGNTENNETLIDAAIREVKEETNLDIQIKDLLYLHEWIEPNRNKDVLYVIFLGYLIGGKETHLMDKNTKGHLLEIEWVEIEKMGGIDFRPAKLVPILQNDIKNGFTNRTLYF